MNNEHTLIKALALMSISLGLIQASEAFSQTTSAAAEKACASLRGNEYVSCFNREMEKAQRNQPPAQPTPAPAPPSATESALPTPRTSLKRLDKSLSQLLNDSWRIVDFSSAQRFEREREVREYGNQVNTIAGTIAIASVPKGQESRFVLNKDKQWALCVLPGDLTNVLSERSVESLCVLLN